MQTEKTIDGHRPKFTGEPITLYYRNGDPITGVLHHYGSARGWQIKMHGAHVEDLYFKRINALRAARSKVAEQLAALDEEISKEHQ